MVKGWFEESRRHRLARFGIKTGRKSLPQHPLISTKGNSMFFPKKDTEKITVEQPITAIKSVGEISTGKKLGYPEKKDKEVINILSRLGDDIRFTVSKEFGSRVIYVEGSPKVLKEVGNAFSGYSSDIGTTLKGRLRIKLDYPEDNKGKRIVTGALIGGAVGALTYPKYAKDIVVRQHPKLKHWEVVWKVKEGYRKEVFKTRKDALGFSLELRKVKKVFGYPENNVEDITIKTQIEGVDITKKPVEEGMEIGEEARKTGFKERVKKVGRGIKTGFEKGQELAEKLRVMRQEKEARDLEKSQKKLLSMKTKLQVAQTKEQIASAKERLRETSPSLLQDVLGAPKKEPKKKFKSIFDA